MVLQHAYFTNNLLITFIDDLFRVRDLSSQQFCWDVVVQIQL